MDEPFRFAEADIIREAINSRYDNAYAMLGKYLRDIVADDGGKGEPDASDFDETLERLETVVWDLRRRLIAFMPKSSRLLNPASRRGKNRSPFYGRAEDVAEQFFKDHPGEWWSSRDAAKATGVASGTFLVKATILEGQGLLEREKRRHKTKAGMRDYYVFRLKQSPPTTEGERSAEVHAEATDGGPGAGGPGRPRGEGGQHPPAGDGEAQGQAGHGYPDRAGQEPGVHGQPQADDGPEG